MPEKTIGMPMTSPENAALPPKCSAYLLPEETMTKNVVCAGVGGGDSKRQIALCWRLEVKSPVRVHW
jgi:hypothetical protein